jgi:hypothetical protein
MIQQKRQTEDKPTEQQFRETLADVVVVLNRLGPYCDSLEELISVCIMANKNNGQLKIIMECVLGSGE